MSFRGHRGKEKQTRSGPVVVVELGHRTAPASQTLVALHGMNVTTVWDRVAPLLASGKPPMRVILPKPRSNPETAPVMSELAVARYALTLGGWLPRPIRESYLLDLLPKDGPIALAGMSWGGGAAARFAAAYPERVSRLVLISPDVEYSVVKQLNPNMPILLIWARDDKLNPYTWSRKFKGHPKLTMHTDEYGGHTVLDSHADIIWHWLATPDDELPCETRSVEHGISAWMPWYAGSVLPSLRG